MIDTNTLVDSSTSLFPTHTFSYIYSFYRYLIFRLFIEMWKFQCLKVKVNIVFRIDFAFYTSLDKSESNRENRIKPKIDFTECNWKRSFKDEAWVCIILPQHLPSTFSIMIYIHSETIKTLRKWTHVVIVHPMIE